jgi:lipoprotein NlpD
MAGPADPLIDLRNKEPALNRFIPSKKFFIFLLLLLLPFIFSHSYGFKAGKLKGVYHRVKKGETLYSIAKVYRVHVQDLAEVNNVEDPRLIEVDQVIFVPDATEVVEDVMLLLRKKDSAPVRNKPVTPKAQVSRKKPDRDISSLHRPSSETPNSQPSEAARQIPLQPSERKVEEPSGKAKEITTSTDPDPLSFSREPLPVTSPEPLKSNAGSAPKKDPVTGAYGKVQYDKKRFIWPVKGKILSRFGIQPNGMYYNWISISARDMAPVVAAAGGTVIFSAELKDYGETIIVKHADNFATVYTHLKVRKVLLDDSVKKGELIALVGKLGKDDEVYLNFEVRHQNKARNPVFFLP